MYINRIVYTRTWLRQLEGNLTYIISGILFENFHESGLDYE